MFDFKTTFDNRNFQRTFLSLLSMRKNQLILSFSILFLLSCSNISKDKSKSKNQKYQALVFDMKKMFTENENDVAFPLWFNQELIKEKKIKSITRKMYASSKDSTLENQVPKEIRVYNFDTSAQIRTVNIEQFYEYMNLGSVEFKYLNEQDPFGYSMPSVNQLTENDLLEQFDIFTKVEYSDKFLVYKSESTGDYKFHMLFKENWGALSLDSILSPTNKDLVVLGSPTKPVKSFYMENTVNQAKKTTLNYSKKGQFLAFEKEDYPFKIKRTLDYDENGLCMGFIDSTFNDNSFLFKKTTVFEFEKELPSRLVHFRLSNPDGESYREIETFEYTYLEE